jgi:CRISPR-associated endonuclease Csn1
MTKIWGFDIGTSSLGWSVISWDEAKPGEVIAAGVRCFEEPIEPKSKASKAIARRTARGMRRNLGRRSERKRAVMDLLQESQMTSSDLLAWRSLDVYQLRAKAIDERLTLAELGRVLLHLSQRRGFQSNRKSALSETGIPEVDALIEESERRSLIRQEAKAAKKGDAAEAEEGIVLSSITHLHDEMEEAGSRTLGSHLNTLISQGEHARRRHTHRAQHQAEFDAGCQ